MGAIEVRQRVASPALRGLVRGFQQRAGTIGNAGFVLPLPARPNSFIEFYFADPYRANTGGGFSNVADATIVGAMTGRHTDILMHGAIGAFNIQFEASGLQRLFGTAMIDEAGAATDVGGRALNGLRDAVLCASDFETRIRAAERWLGERIGSVRPYDEIDHAARLLRRSRGTLDLDRLAAVSGLGRRQMQRRFIAQVGVAPKLYARVVRFDALLSERDARPGRKWTELAHSFGYFDQAHLQRDFHAFAGTAPGGFASPLPIVRA
jgi:AraC-like DNA-binding protein